MRRILLLATAVVLVALAGTALAPASLAGLAVERASRGAATLAGAEGTIWRGRATLVAGGAQMPLAWSMDAWPLVLGQLRIRLLPPDGELSAPRGAIALALGRYDFEVADAQFALPAAMLAAQARGFIRPTGDITFTSRALTWKPPHADGATGIVWHNARLVVTGAGAVELGTVSATLTAEGDRISGPIVNEGGDVDVGGSVTLMAPAWLDVALTVHPRAGSTSPLARTLVAIATPDNDGWRIRWRGDLR
jgi:hypothetical protein